MSVLSEKEREYGIEEHFAGGNIRTLTDQDVEREYKLEDVIEGLSESLKTLSEKLPERLTQIRKRTAIAAQLLAALK